MRNKNIEHKSKRGGARPGAGRPVMPIHLKRNPLHDFRVQQWIIDWLKAQPESGGRLIERAVIEMYRLKQP